jgi:hypothetical protein
MIPGHKNVVGQELAGPCPANRSQNDYASDEEEPPAVDTACMRGLFHMCESRPERTDARARNRYEVHIFFPEGNHGREYFVS